MQHRQVHFLFLNVGHFLDHLLLLIFASAAALRLTEEWNLSYSELIPYATPGFVAFGVCAIPAGWLADKWSREGMMAVFFIGIGASAVLCALTDSPWQIAIGLVLVGIFAAIYHPVGMTLVVRGRKRTGVPLAVNGVFGNMGVACAALLTGFMIDLSGWRLAFILPGVLSMMIGVGYIFFLRSVAAVTTKQDVVADARTQAQQTTSAASLATAPTENTSGNAALDMDRGVLLHIFAIILFTTAVGGLIFQSTTFALPKVFAERLGTAAGSATLIGWYSFLVFSLAAFAQLLVGYLVDHYSIRRVFAVIAALQAVFFYAMIQLHGIAALIVAIAFMLAVFGQIPINDVLVGRIAHSEWHARAYALRYIVTFTVMASTVPLIAWLHAQWGFETMFFMLAIAASCIFIAVLMLPATKGIVTR